MNQFPDFVFVSIKPDQIAVIRATHECKPRTSFSGDTKPQTIEMLEQQVMRFEEDYVLVGHNIENIKRSGLRIFQGKSWVDLAQLAWPLLFAELCSSRKLETLAAFFGTPYAVRNAEEESTTIAQVFKEMQKRYRTALIGENAMTELGGDVLKNLRSVMGF